jgi:hypothetical protein
MTRNCYNVMRKLANMYKLAGGIEYNPAEHDLPRQWFDKAGYTAQEYNKYKGWGYSLNPVEREQMIHRQIRMDRRFSNPPQGAVTTRTTSPTGTRTTTRWSTTYRYGKPVTSQPVAPSRPVSPRQPDMNVQDISGTFR